jgi:hypothetical protein
MSDNTKLSDNSNITLPIRNLISIGAAIAVSTWAYNGVIERLNKVEGALSSHWEEIEENDDWIDKFQPHRSVQDTANRVRELEIKMAVIESKINN